jgi:hypothetical protein
VSEPFGIELDIRQCENGTASVRVQKAVAARIRERTSKLAKATECIAALEAEIDRLREERRWVEGRVVISRETFGKVVAVLSRCTVVANEDGEEWNDEEVIDARDSIRRDAEMLPPGPEKKEVPRG